MNTGCLEQLLRKPTTTSQVDCPICHCLTDIPSGSVKDLPKNYPLMTMISSYSSATTGRKISQPQPQHQSTMPKCPEHDDYLRFYCQKDGTLICSSCELYGSHRGHQTMFLNEAALGERRQLGKLNVAVSEQKLRLSQALARVEETCRQVQSTGGALEDEVDSFFGRLSNLVEERKCAVKTDVRMRTQLRVQTLMEQAK